MREGNVPVDDDTSAGASDNAVKIVFVAVEGRAREEGGVEWLSWDHGVDTPSNPRRTAMHIIRDTDMRVFKEDGQIL